MTRRDVTFYFEGRSLTGRRGEPIAKALFDAGVRTLSYSVKYKRPRGIHCARGRCVTCHMSVNGIPGVPTCITPLEEGMRLEREHYQPFFAPLLTAAVRLYPFKAGFYYRLFNRPRWLRRFFLQNLRKMAGVGRVRVDQRVVESAGSSGSLPLSDTYDVIIVGAGISGMSAAIAAADAKTQTPVQRSDSTILLIDEYGVPGGHSIGYQSGINFTTLRDRLIDTILEKNAIQYHPNLTALGFYPPDTLLVGPGGSTGFEPCQVDTPADPANQRATRGMKRIRARAFVFATGAYDATPLFKNNDMPGIFGQRAIRLLLERDGLRPGKNAVVYGAGDALSDIAGLLVHHGIKTVCRVDPSAITGSSKSPPDGSVSLGGRIIEAKGKNWITGVTIELNGSKTKKTIECDMLCIAFPGQGAYELPYQAGFNYSLLDDALDENRVLIPQRTMREINDSKIRVFVTGEAAGITKPDEKFAHATEAGRQAAGRG